MMFWAKGNFALIRTSCFDLIHAPVSYYFRQNEVQELAQQVNLHIDKLINTHGTTWSMTAKKQECKQRLFHNHDLDGQEKTPLEIVFFDNHVG